MSDTREKLIELIKNAPTTNVVYGNCKLDRPTRTVQTIADHLIANGVRLETETSDKTSEWIPVSERLPEPYITVITCRGVLGSTHKAKFVCNEHGTIDYDGDFIWSGDYKTWKTKVTHWMPLPEPPKGE